MQITTEYIDEFAVKPTKPKEIPLNDWEMPATAAINLDDAEGHGLSVNHWDEWPFPQGWRAEGTEKRWTFVTLHKNGATLGGIGYEFAGLIKLDDLREWFRKKLGIPEADNAVTTESAA